MVEDQLVSVPDLAEHVHYEGDRLLISNLYHSDALETFSYEIYYDHF